MFDVQRSSFAVASAAVVQYDHDGNMRSFQLALEHVRGSGAATSKSTVTVDAGRGLGGGLG